MTITRQIPDELIYEMDNGQPIYYSGYSDCISGSKPVEALMGSSILQSLIIAELLYHIRSIVGHQYLVLTNELGILFSKGNWRLADIAVIEKSRIKTINDKYINVPPNVVFEIDTKAALEDFDNPNDYYTQKTKRYLDFGVNKVIWVYTKTQTIEVSTQQGKQTFTWNDSIVFLNQHAFCLIDIMDGLIA